MSTVPSHVGIVLDGNRRWARRHRLSPSDGHRIGFGKIPQVLSWCEEAGISFVTLWMLSTDNLRRDREEVDALMEIITAAALQLAWSQRWRIHHLGDADLLPPHVAAAVRHAETTTAEVPNRLTVNLAIAYGGRSEITGGIRRLLADWAGEGISPGEAAKRITSEDLHQFVSRGQPDPELLIRTSGEQRGSGFLLWTAADARLWFTRTHWPDFSRDDLARALAEHRKAYL
ncbi:polyprenyl diphosphate synthase [Streptomyces sp. NPDC006692]|uniref:polyprenyl diphosphate synthase n=1 Tax=unclassified Streptomyces TaxID=2593676 RepID=UPI00341B16DF